MADLAAASSVVAFLVAASSAVASSVADSASSSAAADLAASSSAAADLMPHAWVRGEHASVRRQGDRRDDDNPGVRTLTSAPRCDGGDDK